MNAGRKAALRAFVEAWLANDYPGTSAIILDRLEAEEPFDVALKIKSNGELTLWIESEGGAK